MEFFWHALIRKYNPMFLDLTRKTYLQKCPLLSNLKATLHLKKPNFESFQTAVVELELIGIQYDITRYA